MVARRSAPPDSAAPPKEVIELNEAELDALERRYSSDERIRHVTSEIRRRRGPPQLSKVDMLTELLNHQMRRAAFYKSCALTRLVPDTETMDRVDKEP
jgi:hypothetical protein